MWNDTITPKRTRNAIRSMWSRVLCSERGEVDPVAPPVEPPVVSPADNWRDSLPDNIRANPVFEKYNSSNEAHAAFVDVQKLIGPEKIIMPSKEADDNEWNERVYNRLGRPEKPEGYVLPTDLKIPEGMPASEKLVQGFREQAHKLGILPKQFDGIYKWFMNEQIATFNDINANTKTQMEGATTELRTKWGAAFDQNFALGEKVLDTFGDEKTKSFVSESGLKNNSAFIEFLSNIGKSFSEDQLTGKSPQLTMSPEEALADINKMQADLEGPLYKAEHPEHEAMMKKRDMLYRQAYPNG